MRIVAAVLAAGSGSRFGGDKVFAPLGGKPVWRWSFDTLLRHPRIDAVGLVVRPESIDTVEAHDAAFVVAGGDHRQDSSRIAVASADGDIVLIQDAARPFLEPGLISRIIEGVERKGAAAPVVPVVDTLRLLSDGSSQLVDRSRLVAMQTPQGARRELLLQAHESTDEQFTDEMALIQAAGGDWEMVEGDPANFKITTAADMQQARLVAGNGEFRTGIGYDIHAFSEEPTRPLMLGGVLFAGTVGLDGHSDADVVIHAAVDALLGAAALGDIGQHFPNTDERWAGERSITFLSHAANLLGEQGWKIVNLDVTMIAEKPKVMDRSQIVRASMADALGIDVARVSFKATTNEGLGALGRAEGIAAHAIATIQRI